MAAMAWIEDRWLYADKSRKAAHGKGKQYKLHIPGASAESYQWKKTAEARRDEVNVAKRQGTMVSKSDGVITLAEYGAKWVDDQIHLRPSSAEQVESKWRNHILPELGDRRLIDIDESAVRAAVKTWQGWLADSTIETTFSYLKAILAKAVKERRGITVNPCDEVRLPKVAKPRPVILTPDQVERIADNVEPRYRAMVHLGALTGMRQAEMRGLTVDRVTFGPNDDWVNILVDRQLTKTTPEFGPTKNGVIRDVDGDETLVAVLREHMATFPPNAHGLIFTSRSGRGRVRPGKVAPLPLGGRGLARSSMATIWTTAAEGVTPEGREGWHLLRHFHVSALIHERISLPDVAARIGDTDRETLETYTHLWHTGKADVVAATGRLAASIGVASSPRKLRLVGVEEDLVLPVTSPALHNRRSEGV